MIGNKPTQSQGETASTTPNLELHSAIDIIDSAFKNTNNNNNGSPNKSLPTTTTTKSPKLPHTLSSLVANPLNLPKSPPYHNSTCHSQTSTATSSSISGIAGSSAQVRPPTIGGSKQIQKFTTNEPHPQTLLLPNHQTFKPIEGHTLPKDTESMKQNPINLQKKDDSAQLDNQKSSRTKPKLQIPKPKPSISTTIPTTTTLPVAQSTSISSNTTSTTTPYITAAGTSIDWTTSTSSLFSHNDGVSLLKIYLEHELQQTKPIKQCLLPEQSSFSVTHLSLLDRVDFYFACKGFQEQFLNYSKEQQNHLARCIYKRYIKKDNILLACLKSKKVHQNMFDSYQASTCQFFQKKIVPGFLNSSAFLNYSHELDRNRRKKLTSTFGELSKIPEDTNHTEKSSEKLFQLSEDHPYFVPPDRLKSSSIVLSTDQSSIISGNRHQRGPPPPPSANQSEVFNTSAMSYSSAESKEFSTTKREKKYGRNKNGTVYRIKPSRLIGAQTTLQNFAGGGGGGRGVGGPPTTTARQLDLKAGTELSITSEVTTATTKSKSGARVVHQQKQDAVSSKTTTQSDWYDIKTIDKTLKVQDKIKPLGHTNATRESMDMATKYPAKFAEILISKLKNLQVEKEEGSYKSRYDNVDSASQSVTSTRRRRTKLKNNDQFRVPALPMVQHTTPSTRTKNKSRVSEWVDTANVRNFTHIDDLKSHLIKEAESEDTSFTEETIIIYEITCQSERHPYKIKVPTNGMTMTLRQFKGCLSSSARRKINQNEQGCRFFFKTHDKDIDGPLYVELVHDNDIVPLYDGVIRAKIDPAGLS